MQLPTVKEIEAAQTTQPDLETAVAAARGNVDRGLYARALEEAI
jgi:hypothetical protein